MEPSWLKPFYWVQLNERFKLTVQFNVNYFKFFNVLNKEYPVIS